MVGVGRANSPDLKGDGWPFAFVMRDRAMIAMGRGREFSYVPEITPGASDSKEVLCALDIATIISRRPVVNQKKLFLLALVVFVGLFLFDNLDAVFRVIKVHRLQGWLLELERPWFCAVDAQRALAHAQSRCDLTE